MKVVFIFFSILFLNVCTAQDSLKISSANFNEKVIEIPGLTSDEIYLKSKEWIKFFYKNPSEVLKSEVDKSILRIEGFCVACYEIRRLGMNYTYDYSYNLEIGIKDGKIKFDYKVDELWSDEQRVLYSYREFFKKDGTIKKPYLLAVQTMNASANSTLQSLLDFIAGKTMEEKNKW